MDICNVWQISWTGFEQIINIKKYFRANKEFNTNKIVKSN